MFQQVSDNFGAVPALRRAQRRFPDSGAADQSFDGPRTSEHLRILLYHSPYSIERAQAGRVLDVDSCAMRDQDFRGLIVAGVQSGVADAIGIEQRGCVQRGPSMRISRVDSLAIACEYGVHS